MTPYYQDDACTIYHGDCREILPTLPKVDLVLTDPPYGIAWNNTGYFAESKIYNLGVSDWDTAPDDDLWILVVSAGVNTIIWGGNYFPLGKCVAPLVWDKQNGQNRFADGELAWTSFAKGTLRIFRHQWWGFVKESERSDPMLHPTQKPVAVMRWCMELPQTIGTQTILDPFMGSGTTLRAAKDLRRKAIGIEIEEKYCEIAARRLSQEVLPFREIPRTDNITETKNEFQFA